MTDQEIRLKFGEMNAGEMRLARALVDWHEREIANLKAALPDRPQAQPSPWPGQQEAIDAAFQQIDEFYLDYKSSHDDWEHEAPARLAIAQAYDAARPQAAEIASLKAEREKWEADALRYCKNADFWRSEHDKAQAELAALRTPIQSDAGISLGQVAFDAFCPGNTWSYLNDLKAPWEAAAQAVVAAARPAIEAECLAQAIRRIEAVPQEEIWKVYKDAPHRIAQKALESVRARLIAAARGEGQDKPSTRIEITEIPDKKPGPVGTLAYAPTPVVVNEPPENEKQPDLSGESEKQDPYARLKAYAKAGVRIRTHDMEWARDANWTWCLRPESYVVHPDDLHMVPEYAPQAQPEPAQPWTPENAKAYEDFQAELRETWEAQPWTPAVVLAQAIRRMEAVPVDVLGFINISTPGGFKESAEAVRARLIAAARGEGQAVGVNEPPKSEGQPDLSGESEKQPDEPATFEAHGYTWTRHKPGDPMPCDGGRRVFCISNSPDCYDGAMEAKCWSWGVETVSIIGWRYADEPEPAEPWTPAVGDTVRLKSGGPVMTVTHVDPLSLMCAWMNANNELQVEPITTLCLTPAKP